MASAKAKIRHVFGDTFSCRVAPPDILVQLSGTEVVPLCSLYSLILYHIAGETGTKYRIVERCLFNRTMAAYSIFKFQNMNI